MRNDRVAGVLYGKAIGDALGIGMEFRSSTLLKAEYPDGGPTEYKRVDRGASVWEPGDWSDDTEQALVILESMLNFDPPKVVPTHIAKGFFEWLINDGRGAGNLTTNVLTDAKFLEDPLDASLRYWVRTKQRAAPNGAVMRTAYVGLVDSGDLDKVESNAATAACITHYDPRCVASAVAVSVAAAVLVNGDTVRKALEEAAGRAVGYHSESVDWIMDKSLEEIQLDEGMDDPDVRRPPIGYTYKTMGAGMWALRALEEATDPLGERFLRILHQVMMAGGDVDTNAAVAGALLGGALGITNIPQHLVDRLNTDGKARLHGLLSKLVG